MPTTSQPHLSFSFMLGMMSASIAAAVMVGGATKLGIPVSTTHAVVGAVIGFSFVKTFNGLIWFKGKNGLGPVILSWVISPLFSGIWAAAVYAMARWYCFQVRAPQYPSSKIVICSALLVLLSPLFSVVFCKCSKPRCLLPICFSLSFINPHSCPAPTLSDSVAHRHSHSSALALLSLHVLCSTQSWVLLRMPFATSLHLSDTTR